MMNTSSERQSSSAEEGQTNASVGAAHILREPDHSTNLISPLVTPEGSPPTSPSPSPPPPSDLWDQTKSKHFRKKSSSRSQPPQMPRPTFSTSNSARNSYIPTVPSPLNPVTSSAVSVPGRGDEQMQEDFSSESESSQRQYGNLTRNTSPSGELLAPRRPLKAEGSLSSLGRDYDRYPYAVRSNANSRSDLSIMTTSPSKRQLNSVPSMLSTTVDKDDPERGFPLYMDDGLAAESQWSPGKFPMYINEKEDDDYMHNPSADGKEDKISFWLMDGKGFLSFCSFVSLMLGILSIFIILPVLTWTGKTYQSAKTSTTPAWATVATKQTYSTFKNVRSSLVDPDTPQSARTRQSIAGETMQLVFSDEFNTDGRTFYPGDDPFWEAVDLHYAATNDLEWMDPDAITTNAGSLKITLDAFENHNLMYRSGMLQSWNKMCFKGGIIEVSASLAGPGGKAGLWPGIWTIGNLARAGYLATSDGVWPYAYDHCDVGITPNQSSPDGLSYLPGQRLNACTCSGEDHPTPGTGRGAPEIDALEGAVDGTLGLGLASQSSQIAPYDIWYYPDYNWLSIKNDSVTTMNSYTGGVFQQAISGITTLNDDWYDGNKFQKYGFDYTPGQGTGHISWFVGDEETFTMHGEATGPNGNINSRDVSREPMSIVLNLGISNSWTYIDWPALKFPTTMYIDYVRIYQPADSVSVTCDPEGYETTQYIQDHLAAYSNPNFTSWSSAGFGQPKNTLMDGCSA